MGRVVEPCLGKIFPGDRVRNIAGKAGISSPFRQWRSSLSVEFHIPPYIPLTVTQILPLAVRYRQDASVEVGLEIYFPGCRFPHQTFMALSEYGAGRICIFFTGHQVIVGDT